MKKMIANKDIVVIATMTTNIESLYQRIKELEETLELEREEYKVFYRNTKNNLHTSNIGNAYVDEEYYKESQYIHELKKQINSLVQQNNLLKTKNRELIEEIEAIKGL